MACSTRRGLCVTRRTRLLPMATHARQTCAVCYQSLRWTTPRWYIRQTVYPVNYRLSTGATQAVSLVLPLRATWSLWGCPLCPCPLLCHKYTTLAYVCQYLFSIFFGFFSIFSRTAVLFQKATSYYITRTYAYTHVCAHAHARAYILIVFDFHSKKWKIGKLKWTHDHKVDDG